MSDTTREAVNLTGLDDYLRDPSVGLPWDIRIRIADALRLQQAEITRLTVDRDAALAQVAGAFEAAADLLDAYSEYDQQYCCNGHMCGCQGETVHQMMQHFIRALAPADAKAALDRIKRQARAEGMRMAAQIAVDFDGGDVSNPWEWPNRIAVAILSAAEQEGRGDE